MLWRCKSMIWSVSLAVPSLVLALRERCRSVQMCAASSSSAGRAIRRSQMGNIEVQPSNIRKLAHSDCAMQIGNFVVKSEVEKGRLEQAAEQLALSFFFLELRNHTSQRVRVNTQQLRSFAFVTLRRIQGLLNSRRTQLIKIEEWQTAATRLTS